MAYASITSITQSTFATNTTSHAVAMAGTHVSGELIVAVIANDGGATVTTPSGWTQLYTLAGGTSVSGHAYAKVSDGTEGGTTVDFVTSATETMAAQVYRIASWYGSISGIEAGTAATSTTGSTADNPSLTASWGSADNLWLATCHTSTSQTASSAPTSFTDLTQTASGATTTDAQTITARRNNATATEDPDGFTMSSTGAVKVFNTLVIRPASSTTHATTGALTGQGAAIAGSSAHKAKHATTGVLSGQGSVIAGTSIRFREHGNSGALSGQGSIIVGSSAHKASHTTSGVLTGSGSTVAGEAAGLRTHATSGVLSASGSVIAGQCSAQEDSVQTYGRALGLAGEYFAHHNRVAQERYKYKTEQEKKDIESRKKKLRKIIKAEIKKDNFVLSGVEQVVIKKGYNVDSDMYFMLYDILNSVEYKNVRGKINAALIEMEKRTRIKLLQEEENEIMQIIALIH